MAVTANVAIGNYGSKIHPTIDVDRLGSDHDFASRIGGIETVPLLGRDLVIASLGM